MDQVTNNCTVMPVADPSRFQELRMVVLGRVDQVTSNCNVIPVADTSRFQELRTVV